MIEDGNDLTEPHEFEFTIVFKTQEQLEKCALHLLHQEQKFHFQEDQHRWFRPLGFKYSCDHDS